MNKKTFKVKGLGSFLDMSIKLLPYILLANFLFLFFKFVFSDYVLWNLKGLEYLTNSSTSTAKDIVFKGVSFTLQVAFAFGFYMVTKYVLYVKIIKKNYHKNFFTDKKSLKKVFIVSIIILSLIKFNSTYISSVVLAYYSMYSAKYLFYFYILFCSVIGFFASFVIPLYIFRQSSILDSSKVLRDFLKKHWLKFILYILIFTSLTSFVLWIIQATNHKVIEEFFSNFFDDLIFILYISMIMQFIKKSDSNHFVENNINDNSIVSITKIL